MLSFLSLGDHPDPGMEPASTALQADFFFFYTEPPGKPIRIIRHELILFQTSIAKGILT